MRSFGETETNQQLKNMKNLMSDVDVDDNGCHEHAFAGHNLVRLAENRRPGDFHRS